ncbi:MAG TPA: hypothetical protein VL400_08165, partial [Polyangiaceae bacterium]|nr:hypothetical protein [Polyangiaceae bacterium]
MSAAPSGRRRHRLTKAGRAFVKVVAEREGAETQALFRIAVGLVLLVALVTMNRAWSVVWVDASHGGVVTLGEGSWLVRLLGGPTPQVVRGLMYAAMVAAAFVTAGLGGRAATLIAGQLYLALFTLNGNASAGYDLLFTNALWLLTLGAPTEVWSADA